MDAPRPTWRGRNPDLAEAARLGRPTQPLPHGAPGPSVFLRAATAVLLASPRHSARMEGAYGRRRRRPVRTGRPYSRGLLRVGKDCLVSFEASLYSLPAARIRAGQRVEVRAGVDTITLHTLPHDTPPDQITVLAVHVRATRWGSGIVDESHWDGLPDGHTRATTRTSPPTTTTAAGG